MTSNAVKPEILPQDVNFFKNLVYGGVAGVAGSLSTFPIDMAKTRLQEQVKLSVSNPTTTTTTTAAASAAKPNFYTSIFDCIIKVGRSEGFRGLYRGIPVQLIGIIPEKALKLSINDYARSKLKDKSTGSITLLNEAISGAIAGFCQVVVTSPMEMLKIRMQLQSKKPENQRQNLYQVTKQTMQGGLRSTYQGVLATLFRDVPFSVLYFPLFTNVKLFFATSNPDKFPGFLVRRSGTDSVRDANKRVNLFGTFVAGLCAGSVSAVLVTPADVIKTRLQTEGGREKYVNIPTCARMTYAEGGIRAFFKGATGRFILIGPLFGVVLFTYEFMPRYFPL